MWDRWCAGVANDTTMRWIVRDKSFYRSLIALAVPICFQNALTYGVALDTLR